MSVLEAPQTWIAAAAVLVVVAVVLIALAPRRRGASGDGAADPASPTPAATPASVPADTGTTDRGPDATDPTDVSGFDDDAVTAPVPPARGAAADDAVTAETPPQAAPAAPVAEASPATPAGGLPAADARRYVPVTDPARTGERAKDRLLAVLLADPSAAVDVVSAMPEGEGASGAAAAALLRTGLSPTQVAGLCGVDERDLADLVARDLGLLEIVTGRDAASPQTGRSQTEEPGRAWASAGSASSSTTPTTG